MKKNRTFKMIIVVWMVLWVFFLIREDKDGQYATIAKLYSSKGNEKTRVLYGEEFYDFLVFCRKEIPAGSSFETLGFKKFSIDTVRARYFLWPLRGGDGKTDYKIVFSGGDQNIPGYSLFKRHGSTGYILTRTGAL